MSRDRLAAIRNAQQGGGSFGSSNSASQYVELSNLSSGDASGEKSSMLDDAFYNEISEIQDEIRKINTNIDAMGRLHAQLIDDVVLSGSDNSRQLESLVEETRAMTSALNNRIRLLKTQPLDARSAKIRGPQIELVRSKLLDAIQKFQTEEKSYRDRTKDRMARQYMIVNPGATPEEVKAVLESDQNLQVFAQATNGQRYGQSQSAYNAVKERHEEIKRIENSLVELAQLFQDLSLLVEQQGEVIDDIQEKTHTAQIDIEKGKDYTGKALVSALSYRQKRWICFILAVVIVLIIALVVGCEVSQKCH